MTKLILVILTFAAASAKADVLTYTNSFDGKDLRVEATLDDSQKVLPSQSQCLVTWDEQYNDYTNTFDPAGSANVPCAEFRFDGLIQFRASLTDRATGQVETTETSVNVDFKRQDLASLIKEYILPTWELHFPKQGYGVVIGKWWLQYPVAVKQGFDGRYSAKIDLRDVLAKSAGLEPFWCAPYDATANAVWYRMPADQGSQSSLFRNAKVCGTMALGR